MYVVHRKATLLSHTSLHTCQKSTAWTGHVPKAQVWQPVAMTLQLRCEHRVCGLLTSSALSGTAARTFSWNVFTTMNYSVVHCNVEPGLILNVAWYVDHCRWYLIVSHYFGEEVTVVLKLVLALFWCTGIFVYLCLLLLLDLRVIAFVNVTHTCDKYEKTGLDVLQNVTVALFSRALVLVT